MSPEPTDAKFAPGATDIAVEASQGLPKVQLDIDDAPFLREKEQEKPPPAPAQAAVADAPLEVAPPPVQDEAAARKKKRRRIIAAAILVPLLAGGGGTTWWFTLRTPPPPPPSPQVVVVPPAPADSAPADFLIPIAPFLLELSGDTPRDKDKIFFLVCKFTALSKSEAVIQEAQNKAVVIRDALFFYLKNKSYEFLTNPGNTQVIKEDLASVVNGYLTGGQVDDMLFERYVSK